MINAGTYQILSEHPSLLHEATDTQSEVGTVLCTTNIGKTKRLRRWSRGHQFIVRAGGHIEAWQPLYKYIIALHFCLQLLSEDTYSYWIISYLGQNLQAKSFSIF